MGGKLPAPTRTHAGPIAEQSQREAERRRLTVVFCDLVGSTALAEQLDPEDLHQITQAYQEVCADIIGTLGGYVARYVGDGLLAYFGYPMARGDDAHCAVRAALEVVGALPALNARLEQRAPILRDQPLQVRIGIQTGLVVVGDMGTEKFRDPMAAVGQTPNIAARLQGLAKPGTIVIGSATYRLVEGLFDCHELGPQTLKGVSAPVLAYEVLRKTGARNRFEVAVNRGLPPIVNRVVERAKLAECWRRAQLGAGQIVLLGGEAGIGKSRLAVELKASREPCTVLESGCSPHTQNSAFHPLTALLRQALDIDDADASHDEVQKLETHLRDQGLPLTDAPLLASLLSLPTDDRYDLPALTPQRRKQRIEEAVVSLLFRMTEIRPVLVILEDVHWADPSTLELLSLLAQRLASIRILILLPFRPEFHPPWKASSHVSVLMLGRLGRADTRRIVAGVAHGKSLPDEVVAQLVMKTDGVPLFVEELTKTVLGSEQLRETGEHYELAGPLRSLEIPATLYDSLMARLDRLGPAREIAQLGAVLGREFSFDLLQAVAGTDVDVLRSDLAQLIDAEILYLHGGPPNEGYVFKHALIQEAAYESLLKSRRQRYHRRVAEILRDRFGSVIEARPELLAHHCTEGGLNEEAVASWQAAGLKAMERSANVEAVHHFTRGLEVLESLPRTTDRIQQELAMRIALGVPLIATRSYAAPEVERMYSRAQELCRELGALPQLFPALLGLCGFYLVRAELHAAREMGELVQRMARENDDETFRLLGHFALGPVLFWLGEFDSARQHLEQGIELYAASKHAYLAFVAGHDIGVVCRAYAAAALWFLGYPDQAMRRIREASSLSEELNHPHSRAVAFCFATFLHQLRREPKEAHKWATALIQLSEEQDFAYWLAQGMMMQAWALSESGHVDEAIAQLHRGRATGERTGARLGQRWFNVILAEAYGKAGRPQAGLAVLATEDGSTTEGDDRFYEAESHRLAGDLLIRSAGADIYAQAESRFLRAIDIAQRQGAKSLELRAVTSLSQLWQMQGRTEEARRRLGETCAWFREGFATADHKRARAVLDDLT